MSDTRCAHPETSLDVDVMILDSLLCSAINAVLRDRDAQRRDGIYTDNTQRLLSSLDDFLTIFNANHSDYIPSKDIETKLHLLTVANIFLCRQIISPWSPCLDTLKDHRAKDAARATRWLRQKAQGASFDPWNGAVPTPEPRKTLTNNRRRMLSALKITCEHVICDIKSTISLLDILPKFMALGPTMAGCSGDAKVIWNEYATEFMLQASLEQFYVYGSSKADLVDKAFAWDCLGSGASPDINSPSDTDTTVWESQKARLKALLIPKKGLTWNWHLRKVANKFPLLRFEDAVLDLLGHILKLLEMPILMQLEKGRLEGLTEVETEEFKIRVGFI